MRALSSTVSITSIALLLVTVPGTAPLRAEQEAEIVIKVATLAPRTAELAIRSSRYNKRLAEETNGRVQFRTYWGGVAGDDTTVMRKLRTGQIDAAPVGTDILSQYVRQATVLIAPQTFFNYKQVDAVRKELSPEFNAEAYQNGIKVISWWDAGRVRIFSKRPIKTFQDLRSGRPWLYPSSTLLREFYRMITVTGIPLDLSEVYGGLQTGMVDTVWISPVLASAFRWSSHTEYVSATAVNVIQGAFILRRPTWDALSEQDRQSIERITAEQSVKSQADFRLDDEKTFEKLLRRGIKPIEFTKPEEWRAKGRELRAKMIGRTYSKEMLARVEAIAQRYAD
jgi:TRAP-type C4-dicarboxylate transport system substrate-binding protein